MKAKLWMLAAILVIICGACVMITGGQTPCEAV